MADSELKAAKEAGIEEGRLGEKIDSGFASIRQSLAILTDGVNDTRAKLAALEYRVGNIEQIGNRTKDRTESAHQKIRESVHDFSEFKEAVITRVGESQKSTIAILESQNQSLATITLRQDEARIRNERRDSDVKGLLQAMNQRAAVEQVRAEDAAAADVRRDKLIKRAVVLAPAAAGFIPLLKWIVEYLTTHH